MRHPNSRRSDSLWSLPVWAWVALGVGGVLAFLAAAVLYNAALRPQSPGPSVYGRQEFRHLLIGKTPDEVVATVGRPASTQDVAGGQSRYWYYHDITRDPVTGKTDSRVQVVFRNGRVEAVNFH